LPATSVGLLSVGVLNLNNMRDIENDSKTGKRTLVVKVGTESAKKYHLFLIGFAMLSACAYIFIYWNSFYQLLFVISFPLLIRNIYVVLKNKVAKDLDPELKKLALSTLLFSLSFGIGLIL
jgi:1,4-dihydroxy-2-naphthoate octaprenyltransferase